MSVPQAHRDHYRVNWRMLAAQAWTAAGDPATEPGELGPMASRSRSEHWLTPTDDRAETWLFGAFRDLATAYATARTIRARTAWSDGLKALAEAVGDVLDRSAELAPDQGAGAGRPYYLERD